MKKIILIICLFFCQQNLCSAEIAPSSPLKLSEISFKDSRGDWIEISIQSPLTSPINVKDDSLITTISPSQIFNEKFILIHFKSDQKGTKTQNNILHIYTTKSGLTGTTEQITIESESEIIDTVCWQNSAPTVSEQKDIEELLQSNAWTGECIDSEKINKKQSIARITQGKNKQTWQIFAHPTPGEENKFKNSPPKALITVQKGELLHEVPFSLNLDGSNSYDPDNDPLTYKWIYPNNKIIERENPLSHRFETSGTYKISLTVADPFGASDTETIQINALNKAEDLKSKTLLEKILANQGNKESKPQTIFKWQYYFLIPITMGTIFLIYLFKATPFSPSHYK